MLDASSKAETLEQQLYALRMVFTRISRSVIRNGAKSESVACRGGANGATARGIQGRRASKE